MVSQLQSLLVSTDSSQFPLGFYASAMKINKTLHVILSIGWE